MIILDDVDVDYAVRSATFGSFSSTRARSASTRDGSSCSARSPATFSRVRGAHEDLALPEIRRTLGRSSGPLITPAAVKLVDERVREAVVKGAKLHTGGVFEGQDLPADHLEQRAPRRHRGERGDLRSGGGRGSGRHAPKRP